MNDLERPTRSKKGLKTIYKDLKWPASKKQLETTFMEQPETT